MSRTIEIATQGFDETLSGLVPSSTFVGLRVPSLVPATAPAGSGRYLFLLATRTIIGRTRLRGVGQLLSIAANLPRTVAEVAPNEMPFEFDCTSPEFKFADGNVTWHLVQEPIRRTNVDTVATDTTSFKKLWADAGSALLYNSFTASSVTPTGQPNSYPTTLTAYTSPDLSGAWTPAVEGLFSWRDMRFPWNMPPGEDLIDMPFEASGGPIRISLYATVLQTQGGVSGGVVTNLIPNLPNPLPASFACMPEWQFIMNMVNLGVGFGPAPVQYWRIGGRLRFVDEEIPTRISVPRNFDTGPTPKLSPPGDPEPTPCNPCPKCGCPECGCPK